MSVRRSSLSHFSGAVRYATGLSLGLTACGDPDRAGAKDGAVGDGGVVDPGGDDDDDEDNGGDSRLDIGSASGDPNDSDADNASSEKECDVDFLFIIDNSGSMADEQAALAASVPEFVRTVGVTLELDTYHLGVTTTDAYTFDAPGCTDLGSLIVKTGGDSSSNQVCGPYANGLNFMTEEDELDVTFPCAARPGIEGDLDEKPMEALMNAISSPLTDDGNCNEGLIRQDPLLVIVIITDEEDSHFEDFPGVQGSTGDPVDWFDAVVEAKRDPENVVVLSLVGLEEPNECEAPWDGFVGAELNVRIREFTDMFDDNGFEGDVCADNYGPFFNAAVAVIDAACDDQPPPE